jgi:hypothetical protein
MNITNNDLLEYLKYMPIEDFEPDTYVLGVSNPKSRLTFHNARVIYFPDVNYPTHLIISTPDSIHIFDYHSVDYCTKLL